MRSTSAVEQGARRGSSRRSTKRGPLRRPQATPGRETPRSCRCAGRSRARRMPSTKRARARLAPAGDATAEGALALLWELARIETLRQRAVEHLAPVYESRDDAEKLVALADLGCSTPRRKSAALLGRATSVERTGGAAVAFGDAACIRVTRRTTTGSELSNASPASGAPGATSRPSGGSRRRTPGGSANQERLAKLHDARLDDPRRARSPRGRRLALDPADVSAGSGRGARVPSRTGPPWCAPSSSGSSPSRRRAPASTGGSPSCVATCSTTGRRRRRVRSRARRRAGSAFTVDRLLGCSRRRARPRRLSSCFAFRAELAEVEGEEAGARAGWLEDAARVAEALDRGASARRRTHRRAPRGAWPALRSDGALARARRGARFARRADGRRRRGAAVPAGAGGAARVGAGRSRGGPRRVRPPARRGGRRRGTGGGPGARRGARVARAARERRASPSTKREGRWSEIDPRARLRVRTRTRAAARATTSDRSPNRRGRARGWRGRRRRSRRRPQTPDDGQPVRRSPAWLGSADGKRCVVSS